MKEMMNGRSLRILTRRLDAVRSRGWVCQQCRWNSSASTPTPDKPQSKVDVEGQTYQTDSWMNTPSTILQQIPRRLHLQQDHPISITRQIIESCFPTYKTHNNLFPIVSTHQNFDSLDFPIDHPGRSKTDTYYLNANTVLRTHTSAHQADIFRANESDGFLISADVYRRDAIDRSHYPIFHQMEGAMTWDRRKLPAGTNLAERIWKDLEALPKHDLDVSDPNPAMHAERNPLQGDFHTADEAEAMSAHLKRSCELFVSAIFNNARKAAIASGNATESSTKEPLQVRWVEAYFPFTSPSYELEVFWQGDWLEVLGSGVINQKILNAAGVPDRAGWAFGVGLERIAMILFEIPDIRLFWSQDRRFLDQFTGAKKSDRTEAETWNLKRFVPFSKYPACPKDVAFWIRSTSSAAGGQAASASSQDFHENDVMELVREIGGDMVEDVRLIDQFTHPKTSRKSMCYRVNYRSLERTLTNEEANDMHERLRQALVERLGVELR